MINKINVSTFKKIIQSKYSSKILYYCPICESIVNKFLPLPKYYIENWENFGYRYYLDAEMLAIESYSCPYCGSSDRERIIAYFIEQSLGTTIFKDSNIIHFAPEKSLSLKLRKLFLNYKTADLMMNNVDYKVDITSLPFDDSLSDFFICSHVLEHVPNDIGAIKELYRITKPGSFGILLAPIHRSIEKNIEDLNITSEAERWRLFGQNDHVRLYSHSGFISSIKKAGFYFKELDINYFGSKVFNKLGLSETSILYVVEKPSL